MDLFPNEWFEPNFARAHGKSASKEKLLNQFRVSSHTALQSEINHRRSRNR